MNVYLWTTELDNVALQSTWLDAIHLGTEEVWSSSPGPLCFTANTAWSTVQLTRTWAPTSVTLETSTDWNAWTTYTIWDTITLANIWDKVYFRNTSTTDTRFSIASNHCYKFVMTWSIAWSWDANYLLNKDSTTTVSNYCYYSLFYWCTSLTTAPVLPATTLAEQCYRWMFYWCRNLTTAPELPATTLATRCYCNMFYNCTSLTTPPAILPATTLAERCYTDMFSNTGLTTPPALPATSLAQNCYMSMFNECTWLTTIPALPATTLANNCYQQMFIQCSKIKLSTTQTWAYTNAYRIPAVWTWTSWTSSLVNMFSDTGWTFTGTPTINTTYYTSNTVVS